MGAFESTEEELGGEELADGDMEATGITSWDEHDAGFDVPPDDLSKDTSIKNSGSQSLKIDMQTYPNSGVMAKITSLNTSKVYKFTGFVRADSSVVSGDGVELAIDYDGDFAGDRDDSIATYKTANNNITADTFTSFTYYFVPTSTTAYFGVWIRSSGIVHIDDWSVKEVLQSDLSDTYPAIIDVNEPVLGANLFTDSTFDLSGTQSASTTGTYWVTGNSWTIANGTAIYDGINNESPLSLPSSTFGTAGIYKFSFTI
jgi:hypothetical protein